MKAVATLALLLALTGAVGCVKRIALRDNLPALCDVPRGLEDEEPVPKAAKLGKRLQALSDESAEVGRFLASLESSSPSQRGAKVREAAKQAGLSQCLLADVWEGSTNAR